jgi:hypothetical protein
MANQHKHKGRYLRGITDDEWTAFAARVAELDSDRSAEVARFIRWFNHTPGAEPPRRPDGAPREDL